MPPQSGTCSMPPLQSPQGRSGHTAQAQGSKTARRRGKLPMTYTNTETKSKMKCNAKTHQRETVQRATQRQLHKPPAGMANPAEVERGNTNPLCRNLLGQPYLLKFGHYLLALACLAHIWTETGLAACAQLRGCRSPWPQNMDLGRVSRAEISVFSIVHS